MNFKISILVIVSIFISSTELFPLEFSQRTGNTIDSAEAKYFSLFRDYNGFVKAEIIGDSDESRKINIVYEQGKTDKTIDLAPDQSKNLRLYIDNYEFYLHEDIVFDNSKIPEAIQIDQAKIRDFINLDFFFRDLPVSHIQLINGDELDDYALVAVSKDTLFILPDRKKYNWRDNFEIIPLHFKYVNACNVEDVDYLFYYDSSYKTKLTTRYEGVPFFDRIRNEVNMPPDINNNRDRIMDNEIRDIEYDSTNISQFHWVNNNKSGHFFVNVNYQDVSKSPMKEQSFHIDDSYYAKRIYELEEKKDKPSSQQSFNLNFGYYLNNTFMIFANYKMLAESKENDDIFHDEGSAIGLGVGVDVIPFLSNKINRLSIYTKISLDYNLYTYHIQIVDAPGVWGPDQGEYSVDNNHLSITIEPRLQYLIYKTFGINLSGVFEYHPSQSYTTLNHLGNTEWDINWKAKDGQQFISFGFNIGLILHI